MTATEVQELLSESDCAGCYADLSVPQRLRLSLLDRVSKLYPVFSFIQRAGITNQTQIDALNELVLSAKEHGWWDKCDLIYPFVGGTAGAHAQNLKSSNFTITWVGGVTHNSNGITGDGVTGYGDTGYIPTISGQFSLNSAHVSVYRRTDGTTGVYIGSHQSVTQRIRISRAVPPQLQVAINSQLQTVNPASLGTAIVSRVESSNFNVFAGQFFNQVYASTVVSPWPMFVLAINNLGSALNFTYANVAGATVGSGISTSDLSVMSSDWQAFQTALGRQV